MPTVKNIRQAGRIARSSILERLKIAGIEQLLATQAKERIENRGDSEHRYPELWNHPKSYRKGGTPLNRDGGLFNSLTGKIEALPGGGVFLSLVVPSAFKHALAHQTGFETKGPNFIPLTQRASENATRFKPLIREFVRKRKLASEARKDLRSSRAAFSKSIAATRKERSAQDRLEAAGFIEGETYIMAWKGVKVPQRKIFNMPPENVEEIREAIVNALR